MFLTKAKKIFNADYDVVSNEDKQMAQKNWVAEIESLSDKEVISRALNSYYASYATGHKSDADLAWMKRITEVKKILKL